MDIPVNQVPLDYLIDPDTEVWVDRLTPGMVVLPFYFGETPYPVPQGAWLYLCTLPVRRNGKLMLNGKYGNGQGMVKTYDDDYRFLVKRTSLPFTNEFYLPPAAT